MQGLQANTQAYTLTHKVMEMELPECNTVKAPFPPPSPLNVSPSPPPLLIAFSSVSPPLIIFNSQPNSQSSSASNIPYLLLLLLLLLLPPCLPASATFLLLTLS